ncbi:MAG: nucleotidyltransferase domain-containing protein, partial [Candidatus Thorarchaeota archaeon]
GNPEKFLRAFNKAVEEEKARKGVLAIYATGSFARGQAGRFSDIDLMVVLEEGHTPPLERLEYRYIENILVGFRRASLAEMLQEFKTPLEWLWNKEGVQNIKIAYDPHNVIQKLREHVEKQWPTTAQFREAASLEVVKAVEYVHKLLNAHRREDWLNLLYAAFIIQTNLTNALFLFNELPIKSENAFEQQLLEDCTVPEGFYEDYLITKRITGTPDPKRIFRAGIRIFHRVCEFFQARNVFLPPHLATIQQVAGVYKQYIESEPIQKNSRTL